jgi:hypothetical protein
MLLNIRFVENMSYSGGQNAKERMQGPCLEVLSSRKKEAMHPVRKDGTAAKIPSATLSTYSK